MGAKSKKLMVGKALAIISGILIFLSLFFKIFGDTIWGYPYPPWVNQVIHIGSVLMLIGIIIIAIALLIALVQRVRRGE